MNKEMRKSEGHDTAIVLAAGSGHRMGADIPKQYLELKGKPLLYYPLRVFEDSLVDDIIVVCKEGHESYIYDNIVRKYNFKKITSVIPGGKERYDSVYCGLAEAKRKSFQRRCKNCGNDAEKVKILPDQSLAVCEKVKEYVYIHDGARPLITNDIISKLNENVRMCDACICAVPSKDTIKISDEDGCVQLTPDRKKLWAVQTPQVFSLDIIYDAYNRMINGGSADSNQISTVTDDAQVLELYGDKVRIRLVEGSYTNIKITTPDDIFLAEQYFEKFIKND